MAEPPFPADRREVAPQAETGRSVGFALSIVTALAFAIAIIVALSYSGVTAKHG